MAFPVSANLLMESFLVFLRKGATSLGADGIAHLPRKSHTWQKALTITNVGTEESDLRSFLHRWWGQKETCGTLIY